MIKVIVEVLPVVQDNGIQQVSLEYLTSCGVATLGWSDAQKAVAALQAAGIAVLKAEPTILEEEAKAPIV